MKKNSSLLAVFLLSCFVVFASSYISVYDELLFSISSDANTVNFQPVGGIEYDYVLNNGVTFGGGFTASTDFTALNGMNDDELTVNITGVGFSVFPSVGYTYQSNNSFQILAHPIIYQNFPIGSADVSTSIGNINLADEMSWAKLKTGISASALFGWQHFKLGVGASFNIYLLDSLFSNFDLTHLAEVGFIAKIAFIF